MQLYSFHVLVGLYSKSFNLGFSSIWTWNFQMYKLGFEKAEELEVKLTSFIDSYRKHQSVQFSSVTQSCLTRCDSMDFSLPNPLSITNSWSLPKLTTSQWCYPTISSSVVPFSSHLQSFPASGSFQMSQFFTSGGQSIGNSASTWVLPMNPQDGSPLGWTDWIILAVRVTLKILLQHYSSKASIL